MLENFIGASSTIGFDTSAVDALEKGTSDSEVLTKAIVAGFHVLLLGVNADEVLSVPAKVAQLRELLLARCQRLLAAGQCLWPPHYVLELLIGAHAQNPSQFDWKKVDVRARVYERAIIDRDFTEPLCVQQRTEQLKAEKDWAKMWKALRSEFDRILATDPSKRPGSYNEAVIIATLPGGVLWGFGRRLHSHITGQGVTEAEIKAFMDACPPFRGACYALLMPWYDHGFRLRLPGDLPAAGRNDLLMAAYLPYCGKFVTGDAPQEVSLRNIAAEASIKCDVLSYEDFIAGLGVKKQTARI
jgi:hypothetical protein